MAFVSNERIADFVRHVAVNCVSRGYFFFVVGQIPAEKDPKCVDSKIMDKYGTEVSKWARARRKRKGVAAVQYLRFRRTFLILATEGRHLFFSEEAKVLKDIRRTALKFGGFSILHRKGGRKDYVSVALERRRWLLLRKEFRLEALSCDSNELALKLRSLLRPRFAGISRQVGRLLRVVNRLRKRAQVELVAQELVFQRPVGSIGFERQRKQSNPED